MIFVFLHNVGMLLQLFYTLLFMKIVVCSESPIVKIARVGSQQILFECNVTYPYTARGTNIRWIKEDLPTPILERYGDDDLVAHGYSGRLSTVTSDATIRLKDVQRTDSGYYQCQLQYVRQSVGNSPWKNSTRIFLIVNEPPIIVDHSARKLNYEPGQSMSLFCRVTGYPLPIVSWYKGDRKLNNQLGRRLIMIKGKSELKILEVEHSDAGVYICLAENMEGRASAEMTLVVKGGVYITQKPKNMTAQVQSNVEMNCRASGDPNNITYHWLKDGRDLSLYPELRSRYSIERDGSLRLSALRLGASGWYYCLPSNGIWSRTKGGKSRAPFVSESDAAMRIRIGSALVQARTDVYAKAYLKLLYKPQTHVPDDAVYLAIGRPGKLPCPIAASPSIHSVQWKKEGSSLVLKLRDSQDFYKENYEDASADEDEENIWQTYYYEWESVESRNAGLYRCQGFNRMGWGDWSDTIQIIAAEMPHFSVHPRPVYQNVIGGSITVPCEVSGNPLPHIQWLWSDGKLIRDIRYRIDGSRLIITELKSIDQNREIICVATNPLAKLAASSRIRVLRSTPATPSNLTVSARLFSAQLYWVPGFDGGDHQSFVIYYRISSANDWLTMPVLSNSSNPSAYILGLLPNEEYVFSILSRNRYGDGLFSPPVHTRTLGYQESLSRGYLSDLPRNAIGEYYYPPIVKHLGPAPSPPYSLVINLTSAGTIFLAWQPPSNLSSLPPVLYYRVEYSSSVAPTYERADTQLRWHQLSAVRVPQTKYILPELPDRQLVAGLRFRVRAYALLAVSHPSNEVNVPSNILATLIKVQRPNDWLMTVVWLCIAFLIILSLILGTLFVVRKSWHSHRHPPRPNLSPQDDKFDDSNSVFTRSLQKRRLPSLFSRATSNIQVFPRSCFLIQRWRNCLASCHRSVCNLCSCDSSDSFSLSCCNCFPSKLFRVKKTSVAVSSSGAIISPNFSSSIDSCRLDATSTAYLDARFDIDIDTSESVQDSVDIQAESVSFKRFDSVDYPIDNFPSPDDTIVELHPTPRPTLRKSAAYSSRRNLSFERAIQSGRKDVNRSSSNGAVASSPQNSHEVTVLHLSSEFSSVTPNSFQATTSSSTLAKQVSDFTFTDTATSDSSGLYVEMKPGFMLADSCCTNALTGRDCHCHTVLYDDESSVTPSDPSDMSLDRNQPTKDNVVRKRHSNSPEQIPSTRRPIETGQRQQSVIGFPRPGSHMVGASPESGYLSRAGSRCHRFLPLPTAANKNYVNCELDNVDPNDNSDTEYALWLHCERLKAEFQIS